MHNEQFKRQTEEPLYPDVLYNRPITRQGAGRLLLIGGHSGEFSQPTAFHQLATAAGIGECQVVLPDVLAKFLGGAPSTFFVASSSSGSLGREALGRVLELSESADALAIGASLSSNSNTTILVEKLIQEVKRPLIVFSEALTLLGTGIGQVTDNPKALVIATMADIFKICGKLGVAINIRRDGGLINKLEIIQDLKAASRCDYAVYGTEIIAAASTEMTVTPIDYRLAAVPALFEAVLATFWMQNTSRNAGLTTGAYIIKAASSTLQSPDHPTLQDLARAVDQAVQTDTF